MNDSRMSRWGCMVCYLHKKNEGVDLCRLAGKEIILLSSCPIKAQGIKSVNVDGGDTASEAIEPSKKMFLQNNNESIEYNEEGLSVTWLTRFEEMWLAGKNSK